jgi:hypothetical protein
MLVDEDPQRALEHARFARQRASRIAVVREAAGIAAYHAGEWAEALGELRAARRMGGGPGHLAVMADIERALGRPERALELTRGPEARELAAADSIELAIVAAGARRDLGELDVAVVGLQIPELDPARREPWSARLFYAYADNLLAAGREAEALQWFMHTANADDDGVTDADRRIAELTGEPMPDDDVVEFGVEDVDHDEAEDAAESALGAGEGDPHREVDATPDSDGAAEPDPEAVSQSEPEEVTELEPELATELAPEVVAAPEPEAAGEPATVTEPNLRAVTAPEPEAVTELEPELGTDLAPETVSEPAASGPNHAAATELSPDAVAALDPGAVAAPEPEVGAEPDPVAANAPVSEPTAPEPEAAATPDAVSELPPATGPDPIVDPEPEAATAPSAVEPKPATEPDRSATAKPGSEPEPTASFATPLPSEAPDR